MTKGQYPTINKGLGNLTPDLWRRLMTMLEKFEQKDKDETSAKGKGKGKSFFLAKLTGAKNVKLDSNRYIYKWTKVKISGVHADGYLEFEDTSTTSTIGGDDYANGAYNIIESVNTDTVTSTGVDEDGATFPSGYTLQAIGGGDNDALDGAVTQYLETVVMMWSISGRYLFSATNSYDGSC